MKKSLLTALCLFLLGAWCARAQAPVSIDPTIQSVAESALSKTITDTKAEWGTVIVMDVNTGEVKAMANLKRGKGGKCVQGEDYALQAIEPASLMMPISMMVAMRRGWAYPLEQQFAIGSTYQFSNKVAPICDSHSPASLPVSRFLEYSSNIGMAKLLVPNYQDLNGFRADLEAIGLLRDLGVKGEEMPRFGAAESQDHLARQVYGYSTTISPLRLCYLYNAAAKAGDILNAEQSAQLLEMLHGVVYGEAGTAKALRDDAVDIAGKTGTAYIFDGKEYTGRQRLSFCGIFPYDSPQYTCLVVINNPKEKIGAATSAGATVKAIASALTKEKLARDVVENEIIETFCQYARINSQSAYPSSGADEFTMTDGQAQMAAALTDDIQAAVDKYGAKGCKLTRSADNYVYFTIPASKGVTAPSIGISCHLDVTPEVKFGDKPITPIVERTDSGTIIRTDGTTLLGADDKCGCTIAIELIRTILADPSIKHAELQFAFCPNEDIGMAADRIDSSLFSPVILFDIDGEDPYIITNSNFTARGFNVVFKGNSVHPADAKTKGLGDPVAAAATFIASIPLEHRPENSEGQEGYIHPWNLTRTDQDVLVETRIRYFDQADGALYDKVVNEALATALASFPNVKAEVVYDGIQYENVAYTIHPKAPALVESAAKACGIDVCFIPARGGTTASMFAANGLNGGMCVFAGQHNPHALTEYANVNEMLDAYALLLEVIKQGASL